MKRIWLRKLDKVSDGVKFINGPRKYSLEWTEYPKQIMLPDGTYTACFELAEYFEDNEGELVRTWPQVPIYVSLETLMSYFIIDDSNVGRYIKDLEDFKTESLKHASENLNNGFDSLLDMYKDSNIENERDTEDIHTLHSGELETDKK